MTDTNRTRTRNTERAIRNKNAFDEIFGDPFARPDSLQGRYQAFKARSASPVAKLSVEENQGTANPARPNIIDFFCDVESVARIALPDDDIVERFTETYIHESTATAFTLTERQQLEQYMGRLFLAYGIAPVSRYFRSVRKPVHKN